MTGSPAWLWPGLTGLLGVLGGGLIITSMLLPPAGAVSPAAASSPSAASGRTPDQAVTTAPVSGIPEGKPGRALAGRADPAWVARIATAGKLPERALAAYAGASLEMARRDPGCGLGWNTLAAIGLVESAHGSLQGGRVHADGVARPDIVGVPIGPDTDGGSLDHDPIRDRAVGPMQFIPSSWALLGVDGNGDGVKDVHNLDDAALAAAVHLCDVGGDLTRPANWIRALSAYNNSVDYNHRVADAATRYAALR